MEQKKFGVSDLKFDEKGELIDGQHRLLAVIKSKTYQTFICQYNWPRNEIGNIDSNFVRTATQVARSEYKINRASRKMAIARGLYSTVGEKLSNYEIIALYEKYKNEIEAICALSKKPLDAAIHALPFVKALIKYPEREKDIKAAFTAFVNMSFTLERENGMKKYLHFWMQKKNNSAGPGFASRKMLYDKMANALAAYLLDQKIDYLTAAKKDPFELEIDLI
jgi:hypothetical protein